MKNLRTHLVVRFLVISFTAVLLVWIGSVWATRNTFQSYLHKQQEARTSFLVPVLVRYYETYGSWEGVELLFSYIFAGNYHQGMGRGPGGPVMQSPDRVILFDARGTVVYDSFPDNEPSPEDIKTLAMDITVGDAKVGSVLVVRTPPIARALGRLEKDFLSKVQRAITISGIVSFILALILGIRLSCGLARPIERLRDASEKVARGKFGEKVEIEDSRIPDEVKELVRAFNRMSSELESIERKRRDLMRDIAHEIRTPLTILSGNLEALSAGIVKFDNDTLKAMSEEVARLTGLVENLRELDQASSGHNFNPRPVDPNSLIQKAASSIQGIAGKRQIRIEVSPEKGLPEVNADPDRVQQVFSNLLSNAIRYTPPGGWIKLSARKDPGREQVIFTVRDSGPGISGDDMTRIFERFFRSDPSRARMTGGWGLGLAIAKGLVEASGGTIWVEKDEEGGAKFSFTLPIYKPRASHQ